LYVTVKACVPGGFCKLESNANNNIIFEDTTKPEVYNFSVAQYYNRNDSLNFSFITRDLESKVNSVNFGVFYNNTIGNVNQLSSFNEGDVYNYQSSTFSFDEGKYYWIVLDSQNKVIPSPKRYYSDEFLIDTKAPVNSTFNISLNDNEFLNSSILNLNFSSGNDFNDNGNYSLENKFESGLNRTEILIQNATLINNVCGTFGTFKKINETIFLFQINQTLNLTSGYCYNFRYDVYDNAMNLNSVLFDRTLKIDTTIPEINLVEGIEVLDYTDLEPLFAENINKNYGELESNPILFSARWNITDDESTIDFYKIEIFDNTTSIIVKSITNYTLNYYDVLFNDSYIEDNHNYKVRVIGVNKAGLETSQIESNGATVFINKIPVMEYDDNLNIFTGVIFDSTDDGVSSFDFNDKYNFNVSCKVYDTDVGYDNLTGTACVSTESQVSCPFTTVLGFNNFSISCKSNESVKFDRTYNNETDNLDIQIYVEENVAPTLINYKFINSFTNETIFNISENESFELDFFAEDNNTQNYLIGEFNTTQNDLTFKYNSTNQDFENLRFVFNKYIFQQKES